MDKKGPTPAAEPAVKKDKNTNPLLHNGVTNRDVSYLRLSWLDLQNPSIPLQDRWKDPY